MIDNNDKLMKKLKTIKRMKSLRCALRHLMNLSDRADLRIN